MGANGEVMDRLVTGNEMFRKGTDPALLARLAKKQEPFIAVLACSDSRVSPEKVFNLSLGDAFVVRIAGNSSSDPAVIGSLEYAVEHLGIKAILVLGHTDCGAVRSTVDGCDPGNLSRVARDIERARYKIPSGQCNDLDAVAESHVRLQMRMIADNSVPIAKAVSGGELVLLGAMLDLASGAVRFV